jgi:hypothetical protein
VIAAGQGAEMFEYLGYALFVVVMIGCLLFVINSLETKETPR